MQTVAENVELNFLNCDLPWSILKPKEGSIFKIEILMEIASKIFFSKFLGICSPVNIVTDHSVYWFALK